METQTRDECIGCNDRHPHISTKIVEIDRQIEKLVSVRRTLEQFGELTRALYDLGYNIREIKQFTQSAIISD
jgi:hypothetical protein